MINRLKVCTSSGNPKQSALLKSVDFILDRRDVDRLRPGILCHKKLIPAILVLLKAYRFLVFTPMANDVHTLGRSAVWE